MRGCRRRRRTIRSGSMPRLFGSWTQSTVPAPILPVVWIGQFRLRPGDFGKEPDATSISDRGLFRLLAGNLSPAVFRLLQHNRPQAVNAIGGANFPKADSQR